jgi:putative hemolysin
MVIFIIILLILLCAFYVAAEFAIVSARKSRIYQLAGEKNKLAQKLLPFVNDSLKLDEYISACQIGITISSLVLGAYGQATLSGKLVPLFENLGGMRAIAAHSASALVVLLILTIFQMVLSELVPKSVALQYPTQIALYSVVPLTWSLLIFRPFIKFLNGSANLILKLFGGSQPGHGHVHSPEEIDLIISESYNVGLLKKDELKRLHYALHLEGRTARQIMVPRPNMFSVEINIPVNEFLYIAADCPYNHIPLYENSRDNIVGMVHTKEMVKYYVEKGGIVSLQDLIQSVLLIPENVTADKILELLREEGCQQAIVIDEFGAIVGLVTLEDVLAEFMGEVGDEFKSDVISEPEDLGDGRIRLPGYMRLDEVEFGLGVEWEGKSDTVGGLVMETLGRLPHENEHVVIQGIDVEIEKIKNRAITSVIINPLHSAGEMDSND